MKPMKFELPTFDALTENSFKENDRILKSSSPETDFLALRLLATSLALGLFRSETQKEEPETAEDVDKVDLMAIHLMASAVRQVQDRGLVKHLATSH
ncbi:hypothetical protein [Endozoicomonas sp. Mp262]|uniref:hypothetical protein n=1 Tax=Endozoicomonas sp. Mp262 TaxID=2919499 RepID=UPI0021D8B646